MIDSLYFGERRWKLENSPFRDRLEEHEFESEEYIRTYNRTERQMEQFVVKSVYFKGQTFLGIRTWDDIVGVDYLVSRPEVVAYTAGRRRDGEGCGRPVYAAGAEPEDGGDPERCTANPGT